MNGRRPQKRQHDGNHPYHGPNLSRIEGHAYSFPAERRMGFNPHGAPNLVDRRPRFNASPLTSEVLNPRKLPGRYFNQSVTTVYAVDEAEGSGEVSRALEGRKRKFPQRSDEDFISLDSSEPAIKQQRYNCDNNNNARNSRPQGHSSLDREPPSVSIADKIDVPYTLKEARRMFMKDPGSSQIHDFFITNHQLNSFLKKKEQLRSALEKVISRIMQQGAHLLLVGSSINGFGRITSDADLCLVIEEKSERIENRKRVMRTLYSIQRLLRNAPFVSRMQVIPAKVPILKFVDSYSGMECDINVNNLTGIRNTELMKRYAMMDPRVQPIALVIKEWAHQRGINDASQGTLSSYSLCLMVIHFLQCGMQPPVLPCLQHMHPSLFDVSVPITDVGNRADRISPFRSRSKLPLFQLLKKFFEYFAEKFNFENRVISVRLGKSFDVSSIRQPGKEWKKPIKIEEPFDRSNTARAVHSVEAGERVLKQFRHANFILRRKNSLDAILNGLPSTNEASVVVIDD